MRVIANYYLVRVKSTVNETYETESGLKLHRDLTLGNKEWYKVTVGEVVAVPEKFTEGLWTKCSYKWDGKNHLVMHDQFDCDIRVGDKVHFSYLAVQEKMRPVSAKLEYLIAADDIYAYERDGEFYAQQGRIIVTPITSEVFDEVTGNKKDTSLIIPDTVTQVEVNNVSRVIACGKPFLGFTMVDIQPGDHVVHKAGVGDWLDENKKNRLEQQDAFD